MKLARLSLPLIVAIAHGACAPAPRAAEVPDLPPAWRATLAEPPEETAPRSAPPPGEAPPSGSHGEPPAPLVAWPIPRGSGPCPAPGAQVVSVLSHAWNLAEKTDAVEPHHAIAEAVRMRLDELYQSGCQPTLTDDRLKEELLRAATGWREPPDLFVRRVDAHTIMAGHSTLRGSGVALYAWDLGVIRTRIHVTNEGEAMEKQLLLLDAAVVEPPGADEPMLVVANTHIWMSSCWRGLRFRVLAAGPTPRSPRVLLDRNESGRWCERVAIESSGAELRFAFNTWTSLFHETVWRPTALSFRLETAGIEQHYGFVPGFELLVEDWLTQPWGCMQEATALTSRDALRPTHALLGARARAVEKGASAADGATFSHELFPSDSPDRRRLVVYCAGRDSGKPCPGWPKPVDFVLERSDGVWRVLDAKERGAMARAGEGFVTVAGNHLLYHGPDGISTITTDPPIEAPSQQHLRAMAAGRRGRLALLNESYLTRAQATHWFHALAQQKLRPGRSPARSIGRRAP